MRVPRGGEPRPVAMREPRVSSRSWFGDDGGPVGAFPVLIAFSEQGVGLRGHSVIIRNSMITVRAVLVIASETVTFPPTPQ